MVDIAQRSIRIYDSDLCHRHNFGFNFVGLCFSSEFCKGIVSDVQVIDQTMCDSINAKLPFNPQLHAVWHVLCSVTLHFGVQYTTAIRMVFLDYKPTTRKILGMLLNLEFLMIARHAVRRVGSKRGDRQEDINS